MKVHDSSSCYSSASIYILYNSFWTPPVLSPGDSLISMYPPYLQSNNYNITWLHNGDTISGFHKDTLFFPAEGYYQTVITIPNVCPHISRSNVVYYNPDSIFVTGGIDQTMCSGYNNNFTLGNYTQIYHGVPPYTFRWSPSIGLNNPNSQYTYGIGDSLTSGQSYIFVLTVTDSLGHIGRDSVKITNRAAPPAPTFTVLNDDTICNYRQYVKIQAKPYPSTFNYYITRVSGGCYAYFNRDIISLQCGGTYTIGYTDVCPSLPSDHSPTLSAWPSPRWVLARRVTTRGTGIKDKRKHERA